MKTIETLIRLLSTHCNFNDPVRVGVWFGPGSPSLETFDIVEVRGGQTDPNGVIICIADPSRVQKGGTPIEARREVARDLRKIAEKLQIKARAIEEGTEVDE